MLVEPEQQRLGAVELGERDELEPPAGDPQPAVAGDDARARRVGALLGDPLGSRRRESPARSSAAPVNALSTHWTLDGGLRELLRAHQRDLRSRCIRCALVIVLFLGARRSGERRAEVGIGDQQPAAYADARLRALKLPAARMIVP